jgi:Lipase (class 3)
MISEHDIAQLCLDIYQGQPAQWDQLEVPPDGVAFGIKEFPEGIALIFRGSATLQDWLRNAEAIADPSAHQGLGPVHPGFFAGLPELWTRLKPRLTQKPCIVAGHSLGAARASLFTGLMVLDGKPPVRRLCFGEPRPGFPQAAGIIANVRSRSYRNANGRAHDLVTDVPFTSWIEDYVHPDAACSDLRAAKRRRRAARHFLRLARDAALCIGNAGHSDRLTGRGGRDATAVRRSALDQIWR